MHWLSCAAAACCLTLPAGPAAAQAAAPGLRPHPAWAARGARLEVSLQDALRGGAAQGPGVALAAAPRGAATSLGERAGTLVRPPQVTLGAGYRAGGGAGAELSVSVAQEVPLSGVGRARAGLAQAFSRTVESDTKRARLDGAARAAAAWADALYAKELLRLRRAGVSQAEAIMKTTLSRVEAGVASPHEAALASGEVATAQASLLDAEGLEVEALAELRFSLGAPANAALETVGDLYQADEGVVDEAGALRAAQQGNANLQLAQARSEQARQEGALAAAMLGPSISLGATFVREGTGDRVWLGFLGLPLPLFDAAAFERSRHLASQVTARQQVELTRAELDRDVRLALHERQHWREVRETLRGGALTAFSEAFRVSQTQFEVGTGELAAVMLARQRLLGVQEQLARVAARVQLADVAVKRSTGTLLDEVTP